MPVSVQKKRRSRKRSLAKSNKTPKEMEKLNKSEIDAKLATEIAEAEAKGRAHVEAWNSACYSEDNCVDTFSSWIGSVEKIDLLLQAAEERFSATLEEIERHVRGLGRLLRRGAR